MYQTKERIPIDFLIYLRKANIKIEDGVLSNELCDLIEKKLYKMLKVNYFCGQCGSTKLRRNFERGSFFVAQR